MIITISIAALAMVLHSCDTNRAAIFIFTVFYSLAHLIALDTNQTYYLWSIISTTLFLVALASLSRATIMILLLALSDIILALIDLIALVAYNLGNEWLYQSHFNLTYYVTVAQVASLLVIDARTVNIRSIRYNISLLKSRAAGVFVNREKIQNSKR